MILSQVLFAKQPHFVLISPVDASKTEANELYYDYSMTGKAANAEAEIIEIIKTLR